MGRNSISVFIKLPRAFILTVVHCATQYKYCVLLYLAQILIIIFQNKTKQVINTMLT